MLVASPYGQYDIIPEAQISQKLKKSPTPFSKILIIVLAKGTIKPDEGDTRICISDWIFALGGIDSQPRSSDL